MKKNIVHIILFIIFVLLAVGCAADTSTEQSQATIQSSEVTEASPPYRIALVMKTLTNPFFKEMERGARMAETELGIELLVRTAAQETSIEQQIQIVSNLIEDQVDAIVIAPGDSLDLIPVLKLAQDEGIVVINIDNRLDVDFSESYGLIDVPFISVDNEQGAYLSAKYISDQINTPTEVMILEGIQEAKNAQDRQAGALRAFEENENITTIVTEAADWKIDEGYEVTKRLLTENPDIGAIFAANDMMALGAIQYLSETQNNSVLVAAFDALEEAKQAIKSNQLQVTIDQQAAKQGYLGVEYALRQLNGESLPAETMIDVHIVDFSSLE